MRALLVTAPDKLEIRDVPVPEMAPWEALVRIEAASICNSTDVKILKREFVSSIPLPLVLGHESVGTVVKVGSAVTRYRLGDRVLRAGAYYAPEVGINSAWGAFAEYGLVTDPDAWLTAHPGGNVGGQWQAQQIVPPEIPPAEATALINLKETLSSAKAAGINADTWVAIVGTGPVARGMCYWAHWLRAPFLVVFGRHERHCHDFLDLGANYYMAGDQPCAVSEVKIAGKHAFDRVIEAVGSQQALEDALTLVRPDGLIANYGVAQESDPPTAAVQEARAAGRIFDIAVREQDEHETVLECVRKGELDLRKWITDVLPFERAQEAFDLVRNKRSLKAVLTFNQG
ncbi:MAG: alcohol dehydrogenase catalytic domain-containing protein [Chloroflexi bacterium]|mgnify:CR=1 FL=1|nr:alcohol dehydrogenase catalytic domain-containing protein [Chloroflexota bacterium]